MKLLLVDDEFFTRNRILGKIDWSSLDIDEIQQADDGEKALEVCRTFHPDILLADVRMPRMDGIEMAYKLQESYPGIKIIFISGYAEKNDLKNAIKLRAVSYIEKPLDMKELYEVLRFTVENLKMERSKDTKFSELMELDRTRYTSQLALDLIVRSSDQAKLQEDITRWAPDIHSGCTFITILIKLLPAAADGASNTISFDHISEVIGMVSRETGFCAISSTKGEFILAHIYGGISLKYLFTITKISNFCSKIMEEIQKLGSNVVIGVGRIVRNWSDIPDSYKTAVLAMQQTFFKEAGCISPYRETCMEAYPFQESQLHEFVHTLKSYDRHHAVFLIRSLTTELKRYDNTLISDILQYYYSLALALLRMSREESIQVFPDYPGEHALWVHMNSLNFLEDLESLLLSGINRYFEIIETSQYNNPVIGKIIRYIKQNYADKNLSIPMISEYINLAPTYISHIFKSTTGMTVNTFITDYRMQKAKQLMQDSSVKITDIAELVGYRNGNYFSRLFRKYTGSSPSEYRS